MNKNSSKRNANGSFAKLAIIVIFLAVVTAVAVPAISSGAGSLSKSSEDTKTFFSQFIIAGGPIVWFILLPMSIVTVYLAIYLCLSGFFSKSCKPY